MCPRSPFSICARSARRPATTPGHSSVRAGYRGDRQPVGADGCHGAVVTRSTVKWAMSGSITWARDGLTSEKLTSCGLRREINTSLFRSSVKKIPFKPIFCFRWTKPAAETLQSPSVNHSCWFKPRGNRAEPHWALKTCYVKQCRRMWVKTTETKRTRYKGDEVIVNATLRPFYLFT